MDRFASMHDEDIDKLGIPNQGGAGRGAEGEGGWKGRKRARELSELKGRLDRASEKEQQSWNLLKQAVENGGAGAADESRFKATGTNRAADEMRERTVGLVTAEEFRKAREAADALEEAETKKRRDKEAIEEEAREAAKRKAERKKRKSEEKKKRLQKSKMSFALEEDAEEGESSTSPASRPAETVPSPSEESGVSRGEKGGGDKDPSPGASPGERGVADGGEGSKGAGKGGDGEGRSLKGAAPDKDNSSAASMLRARLGQRDRGTGS